MGDAFTAVHFTAWTLIFGEAVVVDPLLAGHEDEAARLDPL